MPAALHRRGDAPPLRLHVALDVAAREPEPSDQDSQRNIQGDRRLFMGQAAEDDDQQRLALLERQSTNDALDQPGRRLSRTQGMAAILLAVTIGLADMAAMEMHETCERSNNVPR